HVLLGPVFRDRALGDRAARAQDRRRIRPRVRVPEPGTQERLAAVAEDLPDLDVDDEPGGTTVDRDGVPKLRVAGQARPDDRAQVVDAEHLERLAGSHGTNATVA